MTASATEPKKAGPRTGRSPGFLPLIAVVLIAAPIGYGLMGGFRPLPPPHDPRSAAFLGRVASLVSGMYPRQVDAETEITRVTALEGVLVYHYRFLNSMAKDLDEGVISDLKPWATRTTCANVATRDNFLKKDVSLRFSYADKGGGAVTSFDVTWADCGV